MWHPKLRAPPLAEVRATLEPGPLLHHLGLPIRSWQPAWFISVSQPRGSSQDVLYRYLDSWIKNGPRAWIKNGSRAFLEPSLAYGQAEASHFFILKRVLSGVRCLWNRGNTGGSTLVIPVPLLPFLPVFPFFLFPYSLCFVVLQIY